MAGDWIPVGTDLPNKREVIVSARKAKLDRHHVAGLLLAFWGWVSEHSADGVLLHMEPSDISTLIGGPPVLWESFVNVGWLIQDGDRLIVPDNKTYPWVTRGAKARLLKSLRQQTWRGRASERDGSASTSVDVGASLHEKPARLLTVTDNSNSNRDISVLKEQNVLLTSPVLATPFVVRLFKATGYTGNDGAILWQVGALVAANAIREADAFDASDGMLVSPPKKPLACYRANLEKRLGGKDRLEILLKCVPVPKGFVAGPPSAANGSLTSHKPKSPDDS